MCMFDVITEIGVSVVSNVVQLIIGCLLSIPLYYLAVKKLNNIKPGFASDTVLIFAFSLLGALLPLGPFGVLPVFAALLAAGLKPYNTLPFLISNTVLQLRQMKRQRQRLQRLQMLNLRKLCLKRKL